MFCFSTINLTNFAPFFFLKFFAKYEDITRLKEKKLSPTEGFDFLSYEWHGSAHKFELPKTNKGYGSTFVVAAWTLQ